MFTSKLRPLITTVLLISAFALCGCAGPIEHWIVATRIHQGDVAVQRGNLEDAELSYQLALRVDPRNAEAQTGFVSAAGDYAQAMYSRGRFDDALTIINAGLRVDPSSVRLSALKTSIEQAKLKREIVISNYPTYREAGVALMHAYQQLDVSNKSILKKLRGFGYTFDSSELTTAIEQSYELQLDVSRNTNRLISYRELVQSGIPETTEELTSGSATSLLPLP